jgi:hypothetical protein
MQRGEGGRREGLFFYLGGIKVTLNGLVWWEISLSWRAWGIFENLSSHLKLKYPPNKSRFLIGAHGTVSVESNSIFEFLRFPLI